MAPPHDSHFFGDCFIGSDEDDRDDPVRCPVLVQKDEAVQALGAHLAKGDVLGT